MTRHDRLRRMAPVIALGGALLLPGCIKVGVGPEDKAPPIRFHAPRSQGVELLEAPENWPAGDLTLAVSDFGARPRYEQRVVLDSGNGRLEFLEFERWPEDPRDFLGIGMVDLLLRSDLFRGVWPASAARDADLLLEGFLLSLDLVETSSGPWELRLRMHLTLSDYGGARTLVTTGSYEVVEPLEGASADGLASGFERAAMKLMQTAGAEWAEALQGR